MERVTGATREGASGFPKTPVRLGPMVKAKRIALILRDYAANRLTPPAKRPSHHVVCLGVTALLFSLSSCVAPDRDHHIVISARDQKLALIEKGKVVALYPVSTSKYGLGDGRGTWRTPLGEMEIAQKIGDGALPGTVFKDRRKTGEVVAVNAPGRDPIVTRIMWLRGREPQNANAFARDIYIHGTPEERNIGKPVSYGCIRMRSVDVIQLYDFVGRGAQVSIVNVPLTEAVPAINIGRNAPYHPGGGLTLPAVP
jgi:lipoprotein-anchoring transpeptidase ErfK/SrfK